MLSPNSVITESLAPAVGITGMALLINGLTTRFYNATGRIRELNKELRDTLDSARADNIRQQLPLFMIRVNAMRSAMFLLFGAIGMMIFTAVSLALCRLFYLNWPFVPVWSFLAGLGLTLIALGIEAYETVLNLKTLSFDVEYSLNQKDVHSS
jgi:hypothetical protein